MRKRLWHVLVTLAAFFAVWLASGRASASSETMANKAPLCDARGAITFAPPPQMQELEVSLDVGVPADCFAPASAGETRTADNGRAPVPLDASANAREPVAHGGGVVVVDAPSVPMPPPDASASCARPGHRSTVDRPPRG